MKIIKNIYTSPEGRDNIYLIDNGMYVRDVILELGIGKEIVIGHISDLHFNYCNKQDFAENDPVLMSTYKNRKWLAGGETAFLADKCFNFFKDADQVILNGDTLDYLSHGCMEIMQREIWDKHPDALATLGGHEFARQMQGTVPDTTPFEVKAKILQDFWIHDIYYFSRVIKDKILVVGLLNDGSKFHECQKEKLASDITLARDKGYKILLFGHEPISTRYEKYSNFTREDTLFLGDGSGYPINFCRCYAGNPDSDDITKEVYSLITDNADVVKAFFAGHRHSDIYLEIKGQTPDGTEVAIPQYVNNCTAGHLAGHVMRIIIR